MKTLAERATVLLRGLGGPRMKYAYADPPYPGCANLYPEKTEVNHHMLIARLEGYQGWALSTNSTSLQYVLSLCRHLDVRVAAWVKPFAVFKPNVNPAYAWEPVIFSGGRKRSREETTVVDWLSCPITLQRGVVGAKPDQFFWWILDLLGYESGDTMDDLYPGTGRFSQIIAARNAQIRFDAGEFPELVEEG